MNTPFLRCLGAGTLLLVSLAALCLGGRWFPVWRLDYWRLDESLAQIREAYRRDEELAGRLRIFIRAVEEKKAIVEELVAERLTLREAARRFAEVDARRPKELAIHREWYPGRTEEEQLCGELMAYADAQLNDHPDRVALLARLRTEQDKVLAEGDLDHTSSGNR
jgi:hypothetical protein